MSAYNLKSVNLPALSGTPLSLFTWAVESPLLRPFLLPSLMKSGGVDVLRSRTLEEAPTYYPLHYPEDGSGPGLSIEALPQIKEEHSSQVPYHTAMDYARAYRDGKTNPEEIASHVLQYIAESDKAQPPLRAFIASDARDVLEQARRSKERLESGKPLSPLDGVPVAVKDEIDMLPYPTHVGTTFMGKVPAVQDSTVVARLRAAGALLVGKANMHEIGINPNGSNAHYGHTRNPFNPAHDTGGSSSGPATAVAAGLVPVAIGADGGGSIRIPASLCGQVGLMSTFGRVSEFGAAPLSWSVSHLGPIGASVADVALVYGLIAGPDPRDPNTLHQPAVSLQGWDNPDLTGMKLGIYPEWFDHSTSEVRQVCQDLVGKLQQAGAQVVEVEVPELDQMRVAHVISILGEEASGLSNYLPEQKELAPSVRLTLQLGKEFSAQEYMAAQRMRTRAMQTFDRVLSQVDAILTPGTAMTAPLIPAGGAPGGWSDLSADTELMRFIFPCNLVGLPAIAFPAGYDAAGLPVGMQAIGRAWDEVRLLRIAVAAEQVVKRKLPARYYDVIG